MILIAVRQEVKRMDSSKLTKKRDYKLYLILTALLRVA